MRIVTGLFIVSLLIAPGVRAEVHEATPADVLIARHHDKLPPHDHEATGHHHGHAGTGPVTTETPAPVAPADEVSASATRSFMVTARQFRFDISPTPFVVNQGDTVTLTIRNADVLHGFFLEQYAEEFDAIPSGGRTRTFVANMPGTFTYFCTISSCGTGHGVMLGEFTVNAQQNPAPTITTFSPTTGPSTGGTNVTIVGTNFVDGATVDFGSVASVGTVTVISPTALTATSPAQAAERVNITVINPDGQSATSTAQFVYTIPGPAITSVSPNSGSTAGGMNITINGSGFQGGATVMIGDVAASNVVVATSSTVTATVPLGPSDIAGNVSRDVRVINPGGFSATLPAGFMYTLSQPAIVSMSPSASLLAGGSTVTIAGNGFTSGLPVTVTFGGVAGTNVKVINAVTLSVVVPPRSAGTVDVVVQVGTNSVTAAGAFRYESEPPKRRRGARH